MATPKKSAKGSKTAHVLNLIASPDASAGEETAAEAAMEQAAAATHSRPLLPPILEVAQSNDDDLAQQIQHALEEELEEKPEAEPAAPPTAEPPVQSAIEEVSPVVTEPIPAPSGGELNQEEIETLPAENAPADEPDPESAPAPEPTPEPASSGGELNQEEIETFPAENTPADEPEPEPAPAPEPTPEPAPSGGELNQEDIETLPAENAPADEPEPEPAPEPPAAISAPQPPMEEEEDVSYTNIMQVLVEEKAPRYIEKFGLCPCKHCAADVKALTLSNLVPKYVVLSKLDRIPMLTVYEGRYSTTIFAQLTRACKIVMDHPHHSRET